MDIDTIFPYFIGIVFAAIVISFVVNAIRYGGLKGGMFGAAIVQTVGEVKLSTTSIARTTVKVHVLRADEERKVGLELVTKSVMSYHMMPFTLSASETKELIRLLQAASSGRP